MPSKNKTPYLGLNQWQGNEYPKRIDFNEDNALVDAALKDISDKTSNITAGNIKLSDGTTVEDKFTEVKNEIDTKETSEGAQNKANTALNSAKSYTDKEVSGLEITVNNKVDKVAGKGLSTNDYTTVEKNKLAGIEIGAQKNTVISVAKKTGEVELVKGDVGLNNVSNYGIATQIEAEEGTSNSKYITPLRLAQALSKNIITGTYIGNGDSSRYVELGFTPKAVFVLHRGTKLLASQYQQSYGGLAIDSNPAYNRYADVLAIRYNSFIVYYDSDNNVNTNESGEKYIYIVFRR